MNARLVALSVVFGAFPAIAMADPVADFYRGKIITMIVSQSPGGDYDIRTRLLSRHLDRFIPGKPRFIVQNMPGAGGLRAMNYTYNLAPRDGTVIVMPDQQMPLAQAFGETGVEFDCTKISYIGNTTSSPIVIASWHTSPVKTFKDLFTHDLIVAGTGANHYSVLLPLMINSLVGTKFKPISGYPGGNEMYMAMESGEVAGRATQNWSGWKAQRPDWLAQKKISLLVQAGRKKHPELPDVPLLADFAKSDEDRQILEIYLAPADIARPLAFGPDVPVERVGALRKAFDAAMTDSTFQEEAKRLKMEIEPMGGSETQDVVQRILRAPASVIARARALAQTR